MIFTTETRTLGDQIRLSRVSRRWSQAVLAAVAKTSQGIITRLENNAKDVDSREKAKVLRALDIQEPTSQENMPSLSTD